MLAGYEKREVQDEVRANTELAGRRRLNGEDAAKEGPPPSVGPHLRADSGRIRHGSGGGGLSESLGVRKDNTRARYSPLKVLLALAQAVGSQDDWAKACLIDIRPGRQPLLAPATDRARPRLASASGHRRPPWTERALGGKTRLARFSFPAALEGKQRALPLRQPPQATHSPGHRAPPRRYRSRSQAAVARSGQASSGPTARGDDRHITAAATAGRRR